MVTIITSVQDGDWDDTTTWDTATVPTASDDVILKHDVFITGIVINAKFIDIYPGGGLHVHDSFGWAANITINAQKITLRRMLHDNRKVNLDGCTFGPDIKPTLSCRAVTGGDGFPIMPDINDISSAIIDDPGHISCSARMRDILPEGCAPAYAEKISNAVRYITATIHIKAGYLRCLGSLYRMAQGPFQVLLVTHTCLIKGFIENVTPDPASVGKEYVTVKVTIAEGPGA